MSQDAEQPRSRKELRRHQGSAVPGPENAGEKDYPSVPLLSSSSVVPAVEQLRDQNQKSRSREHGVHSAPGQQTRQALKAEERARLAALAQQRAVSQEIPAPPLIEPTAKAPDLEAVSDGAETRKESSDAAPTRSRRALAGPVDAQTETRPERRSQVRARDRAALRAYREVADEPKQVEPLPSRRLLRQQMLEADRAPVTNAQQIIPAAEKLMAAETAPESPAAEASAATQLSVTEALAARDQQLHGQAAPNQDQLDREQLLAEALEHTGSLPPVADPLKVDVELLAQQKALAERAAILNERAQARAKLAEESAGARQQLNDPTTAHNLAMVTPLQFVKVPGVERPVLRPPTTSHVPVVAPTASAPLPLPIRPPSTPPRGVVSPNSTGPVNLGSPGQVLRRAEEVAQVRSRPVRAVGSEAEATPMPANSAHGLEPLDAMTAGLGRIRRTRIWQWGVGVVGGGALIAGLIMIISTMAR